MAKAKKQTRDTRFQKFKKALEEIAADIGIKEEMRDNKNIVAKLQRIAQDALAERCKCCGQLKK